MSEFCLRIQPKTRSLASRVLCRTAHYLRKYAQWKTLMIVVRAQSGLENYTFLTPSSEVRDANVYAGFRKPISRGFSNNNEI
jgi:hypothetical protein